MLFQVATCYMLIIVSSPLHRMRPQCRRSLFCTAAMQVFSPVSLVFALHMTNIWNRKNRNRTENRVFFVKNRQKPTANSQMKTITALTVLVLHDVQLLLNRQQQIWGGIYIHGHFSSSTNTVVLPNSKKYRNICRSSSLSFKQFQFIQAI